MQLVEHDNLFGAMEYGFEGGAKVFRKLWWAGLAFVVVEPLTHFVHATAPALEVLHDLVWLRYGRDVQVDT